MFQRPRPWRSSPLKLSYDGHEDYVERTKAKPRGTARAAEDAFNAILTAPPIQERIAEGGLPTTPGQWALLLADSVIADLSPSARQAFDSLCANGCHRVVLACMLSFEPRHVRSALQLLGGPVEYLRPTNPGAARRLEEQIAAAGISLLARKR